MKKAKKLSRSERLEIEILRGKGYSIRAIAGVLRRSPNTVSLELKRNHSPKKGTYRALDANHKAYVRKKYSRFQWKKINEHNEIRSYIIKKLKLHWNPQEISQCMKRDRGQYVSKNSIYRWLYSSRGQQYCKHLYSKRYRVKKRRKRVERVMIPNRVGIEGRSVGANNRSRYGHMEVDTIVSGKRGSGAVSVLIDRKSRFVVLNKLETLKPFEHACVLARALSPLSVRSITFDNGIENKHHEMLEVPTFFCDPYSSWQKGSVENVNKMVRRYLPKGTDLSRVSQRTLDAIAGIINNKPRAVLGFRSAYSIMREKGLLKECSGCPF